MNMNMNGRRLFRMLQDFAYNVAENFGIAVENPEQNSYQGRQFRPARPDSAPFQNPRYKCTFGDFGN